MPSPVFGIDPATGKTILASGADIFTSPIISNGLNAGMLNGASQGVGGFDPVSILVSTFVNAILNKRKGSKERQEAYKQWKIAKNQAIADAGLDAESNNTPEAMLASLGIEASAGDLDPGGILQEIAGMGGRYSFPEDIFGAPPPSGMVLTSQGMMSDGNIVGTPPLVPVSNGGGGSQGDSSAGNTIPSVLTGSTPQGSTGSPDGGLGGPVSNGPSILDKPPVDEPGINWVGLIKDWLIRNPSATDAEIRAKMDETGVSAGDVATATGKTVEEVNSRYNNAGPALQSPTPPTQGYVTENPGYTGGTGTDGTGMATGPGNGSGAGTGTGYASLSPTRTTDELFQNELLQWDNALIPLVQNRFYSPNTRR